MAGVTPFSGKNYHKNADIPESESSWGPCVICGKAVRHPAAHIIVIDGGMSFGTPDSDPADPGYMGHFPIGPECWRKYRGELKDHVVKGV